MMQIFIGNWITLERCAACGSLWVTSAYEPYASFPFAVAWPANETMWKKIHDADNGLTLLSWHAYSIAKAWNTTSKEEMILIEHWRNRSYGRNPIDNPEDFKAAPLVL